MSHHRGDLDPVVVQVARAVLIIAVQGFVSVNLENHVFLEIPDRFSHTDRFHLHFGVQLEGRLMPLGVFLQLARQHRIVKGPLCIDR